MGVRLFSVGKTRDEARPAPSAGRAVVVVLVGQGDGSTPAGAGRSASQSPLFGIGDSGGDHFSGNTVGQ
ncbi:MAG TPA: hypothetical protein VHW64_04475, partial [Nocardioides sp.]|uniref:hypothetical protein n=1 Tax=Nocardioides sp. TaxID=35761 RepID=UPI002E2FDE85